MREIDALDRALTRAGDTITLRTLAGATVVCKAAVRGFSPSELVEGVTQQDAFVIISPTAITSSGWPNVAQGTGQPDIRIPSKNRGDTALINGKVRAVQAGVGIYIGGVLVRIEFRVR